MMEVWSSPYKVERRSQGVCGAQGRDGVSPCGWMRGMPGLGAVLDPCACAESQGVAWDVCR